MRNNWKSKAAKALALSATFLSLQACSPVSQQNQLDVAKAYNTPGVVAVNPYTRTIFSSNNF